ASAKGNSVVVEAYLSGLDHRMLAVNNKLVAVAKREPGHVMGDGIHSIKELLEIVNRDPRRGIGHEKVLTRLEMDKQAEELMSRSGYDKDTVLKEGEKFYLRATANLSTGGTATDVTDIVHPDNRDMAERAIKAVGLDIGGVDFLTEDISRSYKEIGGGIVEVNAAPGFRMHVSPSEGKPRDVAGAVMDMLFPADTPSRIPIAAITGTNGKTTTSRMLAYILKGSGHIVGSTSTDGVYIDGHLTVKGDMTGPKSANIVLRDPSVDCAVLETARGGILRAGLAYDTCDVAACLNVTADHLGLKGIETIEQLAEIKRVVVEIAEDTVVLNADDELCLAMADYTKARTLCYVTINPAHPLVREHTLGGGRAVVLEQGMNGDMITIYDNGTHIPLLWTHLVPATLEGKAIHNVQNAMFAAGMAYSMGTSLEDIRHGLRTFTTNFFQTPGRMNIYDEHAFKVILDYAHNPAAIETMCKTIDRFEIQGRKIVLISAPGDRRDEDVLEMARLASGHFDHYICKADDNRRGRDDREIPLLLAQGLKDNGVGEDQVDIIENEVEAIDAALTMAESGDLLLIFGDDITRCWKQIINFNSGSKAPPRQANDVADKGYVLPDPEVFSLAAGQKLIRDERGVRLAKADEQAD
ncbi:MAG: cyanophycin synthetase, partial [Gammaproteobacteria bacterium]